VAGGRLQGGSQGAVAVGGGGEGPPGGALPGDLQGETDRLTVWQAGGYLDDGDGDV